MSSERKQQIHALVIMDDPVPKAVHLVPWDFRVCLGKCGIAHTAQLTHLAQVEDTGLDQL